jgi:hypothetical protein
MLLCVLSACKTTPPPAPVPQAEAPAAQFEPLAYTAQIQRGEGKYADLYAPTSYAVWVGPEVTAMKRDAAAQEGQQIEPWLDRAAQVLPANYVVIECHVDSAFRDSSLAYDAVSFRNMDTYLELPDGHRVAPIQVLIDPHAREISQGTLKAYSRVNLLVFTRENVLVGTPALPSSMPGVRLVVKGVDTTFHFDWQGLGGQRTTPWANAQQAAQAVQLGFKDFYGRLQTLAHIFD